jgi:hypothetical protein
MRALGPITCLPLLAIALVLCLGCNASKSDADKADSKAAAHDDHDDHEHEGHEHEHAEHGHHHAETYAEAVEELEGLRDTLRDSLKAGDREKGDAAVHEIGHVLDNLEGLAKRAELSAEKQVDVKKDVEALFVHFDKIDEAFHASDDQEVPYDEHAEDIDAAIERLHGHTHTEESAPQ